MNILNCYENLQDSHKIIQPHERTSGFKSSIRSRDTHNYMELRQRQTFHFIRYIPIVCCYQRGVIMAHFFSKVSQRW